LRIAAAECKTGIEQRATTDPTIIASRIRVDEEMIASKN